MGKFIRRDEQGATIVIVAISVVALLTMTGLAIDGGRLYSDRRQVQNAADAAALAGAVELNTLVTGDEASIYTAVQARVSGNQAFDSFTCQIIDQNQNVLQSCPTVDGPPGVDANAAGVKVLAANTQNTSFMRVAGVNTFSASASAAATLQRFIPTGGSGPIMVCAVEGSDPRSGPNGQGQSPSLLLPDDSINPAAVYDPATGTGPVRYLKGVEVKRDCSTGSDFKGLVDPDNVPYPIPGTWNAEHGNRAGPTRFQVAGACSQLVIGCRIVLPLCYWQSGVTNDQLHCVRFGVFQITDADANTISGGLIGNAVVDGGQGGGKPNDPTEPRVIRLVT